MKKKSGKTPVTKGKRTGPGLKPGLNEADTGSVVHQAKGHAGFGKYRQSAKGKFTQK